MKIFVRFCLRRAVSDCDEHNNWNPVLGLITRWSRSLNIFLLKKDWEECLCHAVLRWISCAIVVSNSPHVLQTDAGQLVKLQCSCPEFVLSPGFTLSDPYFKRLSSFLN